MSARRSPSGMIIVSVALTAAVAIAQVKPEQRHALTSFYDSLASDGAALVEKGRAFLSARTPALGEDIRAWLAARKASTLTGYPERMYADRVVMRLGKWPEPKPVPLAELAPDHPRTIARVGERLTHTVAPELYDNFDTFLYVSKAVDGPWAQHMFVFEKDGQGVLKSRHVWPVSTGRESVELSPSGAMLSTETPEGYYQLDPSRMYERWRSTQWQARMPHAMFFNWIDRGLPTGLAIHGAGSWKEASIVGQRGSSGCVRLAPDAARTLFHLIREKGEGDVPLFAYDKGTRSLSRSGDLVRKRDGSLRFAKGYRVLVIIENYGGDAEVSALF